jgi:phosphate uptake regulator
MVLKELLAFLHDDTPLREIIKRFNEMVILSKDMFERSSALLTGTEDVASLREHLLKMDSRINTLQQIIRRDAFTHVSVQGTGDIVPCMLLVSLTKDVERIGDYCKNIEEVVRQAPHIMQDPLLPDLIDMRKKMLIWFEQTKRAFDRNDHELARATREEAYLHEKECDRLVWKLAKDNEGRNAVPAALTLRFFKRIAAHLGNVCTSVVMPFDKLDYYDKISDAEQ